MNPPACFKSVASSARCRWEQLENDRELAAPWHQLFRQVQSPRHVLSELLQNADDAGAKSASVRVLDDEFVFEHDGEDFTVEQFQSLCRFGYSNKGNMHTIGFRGVGFKSTFSLGSRVRVQTPTLDVVFDRQRFTMPIWSNNATATPRTRVSVVVDGKPRLVAVRKNLEAWASSPASMLFFRNLQELTIESHRIRKEVMGRGPIADSQRIRLTGVKTEDLILIRSAEEPFPEEVVSEIQEERNAEALHLPPCSVELVLGLEGEQRLFVVLPAGTEVALPFSINAPFLQNPDRTAIKDPETSVCNQWLLNRAGKLASDAMVTWLEREQLSLENRANAYRLLRGPVVAADDLCSSVTKQVMDTMLEALEGRKFVLTVRGSLAAVGDCTALPAALHEVWEPKQLSGVFAAASRHLLSPVIPRSACQTLEAHGWVQSVSVADALQALGEQAVVPKPSSWTRLQLLWGWVEENIGWEFTGDHRRALRIVPVEGQTVLHPAKDVIRVSARRDQLAEADWNFISDFALAIDRHWIAHLSKLRSKGEDEDHPVLTLLQALALHEPSQVDRIAAQASRRLLARKEMPTEDCVRIAHIFAALDATVPEDFQYVTEDESLRQVRNTPVVFDPSGEVENLVPEVWAKAHLLHSDYVQTFTSCSRDRWYQWANSAKSRLYSFVPITKQDQRFNTRPSLVAFLQSQGGESPAEYHFKNDSFVVGDFDFPAEIRQHWLKQGGTNPKLWASVIQGILKDSLARWKLAQTPAVHQKSTQRTDRVLSCGPVLSAWLVRLRSLPCLADTHGNQRMPPELLLRTPDTESLLGIEPFVDAELDKTPDHKSLLRLLGVRDSATSWEKVVDRLRGLTRIKDTIRVLMDVLGLYEVLDRISMRCSAEDLNALRAIFDREGLVLSNSLEWFSSGEVSLHADPEDDSPVVHAAAHSRALWLRLKVPERPSLEKSLEWLRTLSPGTRLDGPSYTRATVALTRGGRRVWEEIGHWLSLDQTWEAVATLKYRVSRHNPTRWEKLSAPTKQAAADLRMLHGEVAEEAPFTLARPLAEAIAWEVTRVQPTSGRPRRSGWLEPLADGLCRVKLGDEVATARVRAFARRLLNTTWHTVSRLEVTPYIDGIPAGEPLMPNVLWSGTKLYIVDQSTVRLYRELKDELASPFDEARVMEAVAYCIDRDEGFVREYLAANFELDAQAEPPPNGVTSERENERPKPGEGETAGEAIGGPAETVPVEENDDTGKSEVRAEDTLPKTEQPAKPSDLSFMDRYAKARGYRWHEAERCYTHAKGAWIDKAEAPFNWQEHASGGDVTKSLFVAEASLARGVEIPCDLWRLMENNPDSIALVLCNGEGEPNEWSASELQELKNADQIRLYQSRFILREVGAGAGIQSE